MFGQPCGVWWDVQPSGALPLEASSRFIAPPFHHQSHPFSFFARQRPVLGPTTVLQNLAFYDGGLLWLRRK